MASLFRFTALAAGLASIINGVDAGADANVYGCIYIAKTPPQKIGVNFFPGGSTSRCMYETGTNAYLDVVNSGITCVSVGFVSSKSSSSGGDLCATTPSRWRLGYDAGAGFTGSTFTDWSAPIFGQDTVKLIEPYSPGTQLCRRPEQCGVTYQSFGGTPDLYVIFAIGAFQIAALTGGDLTPYTDEHGKLPFDIDLAKLTNFDGYGSGDESEGENGGNGDQSQGENGGNGDEGSEGDDGGYEWYS
jgi:hypothetical protein